MVAGGFGGRIGAARIIGRVFGELARGAKRAEHLVGRDVVETEAVRLASVLPIGAGGLEQGIGAGDVGLDKRAGAVDGSIHVGFSRQMHHRIGLMVSKDPVKRCAVANIGLFKRIERAVGHAGDVLKTGRIGQRIEINHAMPLRHGQPYYGRADKPCTPRYQ